jgi:PKD domain-containing protein
LRAPTGVALLLVVFLTQVAEAAEGCSAPRGPSNLLLTYTGAQSGCSHLNNKRCLPGEQIRFGIETLFGTTFSSCDRFTWSFGNGAAAEGRNVVYQFPRSGDYFVRARVSNEKGNTTITKLVDVQEINPPTEVVIISLRAEPSTVKAGEPVTLRWTAQYALRLELSPLNVTVNPVAGSYVVRPLKTQTYIATGYGRAAIGTARVTVTVIDPSRRRAVGK